MFTTVWRYLRITVTYALIVAILALVFFAARADGDNTPAEVTLEEVITAYWDCDFIIANYPQVVEKADIEACIKIRQVLMMAAFSNSEELFKHYTTANRAAEHRQRFKALSASRGTWL